MNCLINFLADKTQKSLIDMVQNRDETFECELDSYRRLFKVELNYCLGRNNSSNKNTDINEENFCHNEFCNYKNSCYNFYCQINKIKEEEIDYFFNGIRMCYLYWIDSKTTLALESFDYLMKKYKLIDKDLKEKNFKEEDKLLLKDIENRVFFRARVADQFLSKKEMFHVPFNKRYNLRNERFSLTGQPLLYLGNSIAGVAEELGVDIDDEKTMEKLRISSFELRESKDKKDKKRIFDLRCYIMQDLKNVSQPSFNEQHFFRNILSEICSFQKRKELEDYAFKEEYVIPQMLAQVLKQNHYDGICYYSTKRFNGYEIDGKGDELLSCEEDMKYRENVVLFTHMSEDGGIESYDEQLFDSMEISMPVSFNNVKLCSENELFKLKNVIESHFREVEALKSEGDVSTNNYTNIVKSANIKASSIVNYYDKVFSKIKINEKKYSYTKLGQIHLQLLIGILNRLLVESELLEDKSAQKIAKEKKTKNHKSGVDNIKLIQCNVLGEKKDIKNGNSCNKYVHDNGCLHKSKVIFPYRITKDNKSVEIAFLNKTWEELFYFHETYNNCEYEKVVKKYENWPLTRPKNIGSFIFQQYSIIDFSENYYRISDNFEYVSVDIIEWNNCNDKKIKWINMAELEKIFMEDYKKMTPVYQQALPILIRNLNEEFLIC